MKRFLLSAGLSAFGFFSLLAQSGAHYEIWFSAGNIRHHALLVEESDKWSMRVQYYDASARCNRLIEESFGVEAKEKGLILKGKLIKNLRSGQSAPNYSPDNFYLYFRKDGAVHATNIDDAGSVASLSIQTVAPAEVAGKRKIFYWEE